MPKTSTTDLDSQIPHKLLAQLTPQQAAALRRAIADAPTTIADHQHTNPEVQKLRNAVEFMDCLSQDGFSEIESIANLALAYLETPAGYRHLDNIAHALLAIRNKASETENCINCEAEKVGCNHTDDAERRRMVAQYQALKAGAEVQS
ncbi:MAG: hypothetical protein QM718_04815 [Steroidobacteraceae bacterium]